MKNIHLCLLAFLFLAIPGCKKENGNDNPGKKSTIQVTTLLPLSDSIPFEALGSGKIVFERTYAQGGSSFYMIDVDNKTTSGFQTENPMTQPCISPDGSKIACSIRKSADVNAAWNIYVMNTDGSECFPAFSSDTSAYFPTWNNDGSKIIFYTGGKGGKLYRQSPAENATDREELAKFSYDDDPDWFIKPVGGFSVSAEGHMVAVSRSESLSGVIDLVPNSGKQGVNLLLAPTPEIYLESVESPVYSPDGSKIAFMGTLGDIGTPGYVDLIINVMDTDGSNHFELGGMGGYKPDIDIPRYTSLCWSPDGTKILFAVPDVEGTCHLYLFYPYGTGFTRVTTQPGIFDSNVSWTR
jgi:Tol biopolymer transport system component